MHYHVQEVAGLGAWVRLEEEYSGKTEDLVDAAEASWEVRGANTDTAYAAQLRGRNNYKPHIRYMMREAKPRDAKNHSESSANARLL